MPSEPVKFSEYTEEHYILRTSIYNKVLNTQFDGRFFSQQEWKNMMRGKDPIGREMRIKRSASEWLTYEEILKITGDKPNEKTSRFDYLCIKLPNEVFCIDDVRPVTPSWCIDKNGFYRLYTLIDNDFKRSIVDWVIATCDYCSSNGRIVIRAQQAMLERYLMRYSIEMTETEKDSLRRVISRWLSHEQINYNSYTSFDMNYEDRKEHVARFDAVEWD